MKERSILIQMMEDMSNLISMARDIYIIIAS